MAFDQERRFFTRNTHMVGVVRGIIETERRLAAGRRELDRYGPGEIFGDAQVTIIENAGRLLQDTMLARFEIERHD